MQELGSINTKVIEKLTELNCGIKYLYGSKSERNVQDPQTLLAVQVELVAEYNGNLIH
jgi:hypothetical protein